MRRLWYRFRLRRATRLLRKAERWLEALRKSQEYSGGEWSNYSTTKVKDAILNRSFQVHYFQGLLADIPKAKAIRS